MSRVLDEIEAWDVHNPVIEEQITDHVTEEQVADQVRLLLESWVFRAACQRIGTIENWPIRIYHLGIGINNRSILDTVINDEPGLWAVEVQLR